MCISQRIRRTEGLLKGCVLRKRPFTRWPIEAEFGGEIVYQSSDQRRAESQRQACEKIYDHKLERASLWQTLTPLVITVSPIDEIRRCRITDF